MDYKTKKIKNQVLQEFIKNKVSEKNLNRIHECGSFLLFHTDERKEKKRLVHSNSCKNRFCAMCAYKNARKDAMKISIMLKYLENNCQFLFLTLTSPNVTSDNLADEITDYNKAFKRFSELKLFRGAVVGYIRKLEIVYDGSKKITKEMYKKKKEYYDNLGLYAGDKNSNYNKYHPHFHVLLAVKKNYFSNNYIKRDTWLEMWQKAKRDESITQVDVRKLDMKKGVSEIAKYSSKDSDYLMSQEVFDVMYKALKGRQIITYNGVFKESAKLYKKGDLDYLKDIDLTEYVYRILYQWGQGDYVQREIRELTDEEKERFNKQLIDEIDIEE
jgi:plasmid rolling circle replication initiator protein Rep